MWGGRSGRRGFWFETLSKCQSDACFHWAPALRHEQVFSVLFCVEDTLSDQLVHSSRQLH